MFDSSLTLPTLATKLDAVMSTGLGSASLHAQAGALISPVAATFALAVALSPGPSNMLLLVVGSRRGVRAGAPLLGGMALGYGALWAACAGALSAARSLDPQLLFALRWTALVLLLAMSVGIVRSLWSGSGANPSGDAGALSDRMGLAYGFLFQTANPKAWATGLVAAALFAPSRPEELLALAAIAFLAVTAGCGLWLVAGMFGSRWLTHPLAERLLSLALAATLGASAFTLIAT